MKESETLSTFIYKLREQAINTGLAEKDFWDMTIGEVDRYIKGYIFREDRNTKYKAKMDYLLARTIVSGIGASFNGKPMPTIYQCYPDFFDEEADRTRQSVANFINFANAFNKRFKEKHSDTRTTQSNN